MAPRRYNCGCGKKRYRDERAALAAASADQRRYGVTVAVYRCPGGLAWHLTSRGPVPEALPSVGRRLAFALLRHGAVDLGEFMVGLDARRRGRAGRCAEQMTALGLTAREESATGTAGLLHALDRQGLARVTQIGLDGYLEERRASPPAPSPSAPAATGAVAGAEAGTGTGTAAGAGAGASDRHRIVFERHWRDESEGSPTG